MLVIIDKQAHAGKDPPFQKFRNTKNLPLHGGRTFDERPPINRPRRGHPFSRFLNTINSPLHGGRTFDERPSAVAEGPRTGSLSNARPPEDRELVECETARGPGSLSNARPPEDLGACRMRDRPPMVSFPSHRFAQFDEALLSAASATSGRGSSSTAFFIVVRSNGVS